MSAMLVMMLVSALLVGFVAAVSTDQFVAGTNRVQTQAAGAAHAGLEKLTGDLGQLFLNNFNPTGAQIAALTAANNQPNIPGVNFVSPGGGSGYRITYRDTNPADGSPDLENPNGSPLSSGPYQGLIGLITPYEVEVTAQVGTRGEVRMRRTMQTVAIPVFQFGIFSENSQSFFAGPNFAFGGRVHTNQHLFLKQDNGATLTLQDRVTAVGEIIRTKLANGQPTHNGTVRMAFATGCPAAPAAIDDTRCRNLELNEGSVVDTVGSADNEPTWTEVVGEYGQWLRNGRTGARRLDLPIVSDGATPFDLIKRAPAGEAVTSNIGKQRFHNLATLRILLSDRPEDLQNSPGAVWTAAGANASPIRLSGGLVVPGGSPGSLPANTYQFAASTGVINDGFRTTAGTSSIDGWILINRQDRAGNWTDVTKEILNLGFAGRRLSTNVGGVYLDNPDFENACQNAHLNAVIRVQRVADTVSTANCLPAVAPGTSADFWPNVLYDPREGMLRDDENNRPVAPAGVANVALNQPRVWWGGVMHYVELDVNNLRRWLNGSIGTSNSAACVNGAGATTCPMDVTGFVVYFSDRRTNRNLGNDNAPDPVVLDANGPVYPNDQETGELGFEDNINPGDANSRPNGAMDAQFTDAQGVIRWAEDINQNAPGVPLPETYGGRPRLMPSVVNVQAVNQMRSTGVGSNLTMPWDNTSAANIAASAARYQLFGTPGVYGFPIDRNVARVNRAFFFRRALKLVNGGRGNLPANGSQGLTVSSENPVYVEGNYNACTNVTPALTANGYNPACVGAGFGTVPGQDHVSAAVIADTVTMLSNAWNDIRSFRNPHDASVTGANNNNARQGITTWYRMGIISGKGLNFQRPSNNAADHTDFGTDGGAHNFLRFAENWGGQTLNYRGSLISLYTSRQAVGIYKCCSIVYSAPNRGYNFDQEFLSPSLLPPRTPMFRDLNTLTFRQILRPTQ